MAKNICFFKPANKTSKKISAISNNSPDGNVVNDVIFMPIERERSKGLAGKR